MTDEGYLRARGWSSGDEGQWYKNLGHSWYGATSTALAVALQVEEDLACAAFAQARAATNADVLAKLRGKADQ